MCTLAFISFRGCLYLCIPILLLQPKATPNEPVPLGTMLTKAAVRDNLPPVARALASMNSKWRPLLKHEVTHLVINSLWTDSITPGGTKRFNFTLRFRVRSLRITMLHGDLRVY